MLWARAPAHHRGIDAVAVGRHAHADAGARRMDGAFGFAVKGAAVDDGMDARGAEGGGALESEGARTPQLPRARRAARPLPHVPAAAPRSPAAPQRTCHRRSRPGRLPGSRRLSQAALAAPRRHRQRRRPSWRRSEGRGRHFVTPKRFGGGILEGDEPCSAVNRRFGVRIGRPQPRNHASSGHKAMPT